MPILTKSERLEALFGRKKFPLVRDFAPRGRSGSVIYAVQLVEHDTVIKVGRSIRWASRRGAYDQWNLRPSGGIKAAWVFTITDEYVDLPALEGGIIAHLQNELPVKFGREWFVAEMDDVLQSIGRFLTGHEISFDLNQVEGHHNNGPTAG